MLISPIMLKNRSLVKTHRSQCSWLSHNWRRSGQPFVSNTEKETSGHSAFSVTPGDLLFLSRSREEARRDCDGCIIYPLSSLFYHRKSIVGIPIPPALPSRASDIISKDYIFSCHRSCNFSFLPRQERPADERVYRSLRGGVIDRCTLGTLHSSRNRIKICRK